MNTLGMKSVLVGLCATALTFAAHATSRWEQENRPCRILTFGNSFSIQVDDPFPKAAKAMGKSVDFADFWHPACTLKKHSDYMCTNGFYSVSVRFTTPSTDANNPFGVTKGSGVSKDWCLTNVLAALDWDIVTLQQRSGDSPNVSTYEPYLGHLVAKIRELAPNAKIYFHQTWSFDRYASTWAGDVAKRDAFYDQINSSVREMAAKYDLGVIPVGYATQLYRYRKPVLAPLDDYCAHDHLHFNSGTYNTVAGRYLQALVFAGALLGEVPTCEQFPSEVADAALVRQCAVDACAATDYANYGQGTVDFSWNVTFRDGDTVLSSASVTNGAAATLPSAPLAPANKTIVAWAGEKTVKAKTDVATQCITNTPAQVAAMQVYDDITWTAVWGEEEVEEIGGGGDEGDGEGDGDGDATGKGEVTSAEGQTILSTTDTAYGYTRRVQVGDDASNVYVVNVYTNTSADGWTMTVPPGVTQIDYMAVAGGGGGGAVSTVSGGGGGAGGFVTNSLTVVGEDTVGLFVGAGGASATSGDPSFVLLNGVIVTNAFGGGKGGTNGHGGSGGSGGGGSWKKNGGSGTIGQGFAGGTTTDNGSSGGGGAGGPGESETESLKGGSGGPGVQCDITGEMKWYAGGGGGGLYTKFDTSLKWGNGGSGVGGDGGHVDGSKGSYACGCNGVDGTGSGGGGASGKGTKSSTMVGGKGGDGVVVLRYKEVAGKKSFEGATVVIDPESAVYDGEEKTFALVSLTLPDKTFIDAKDLVEGTDYDFDKTCVGPTGGEYLITVTGKGDSYYGSATVTFTIEQAMPQFAGELSQAGWKWGEEPPKAQSTLLASYGEVVIRYYTDAACTVRFTPSCLTEGGTYYVRGEVDETASWMFAATDAVSFTVDASTKPQDVTETETDYGKKYTMTITNLPHTAYAYTNCTVGVTNTFVVPSGVRSLECLVVAGGGAGGHGNSKTENSQNVAGGGGGAGGYVSKVIRVRGGDVVQIVVGQGGVQGSERENGTDSLLIVNGMEAIDAIGGGHGGNGRLGAGGVGGSGGGNTWSRTTRIAGTPGQGNAGGLSGTASGTGIGGGGGGAGGVGGDRKNDDGGLGGVGLPHAITGTLTWYAAGGGGGAVDRGDGGVGGSGIGGRGGDAGNPGCDAVACSGSGGGGGGKSSSGTAGGAGGSGIVILRHAKPTPGFTLVVE